MTHMMRWMKALHFFLAKHVTMFGLSIHDQTKRLAGGMLFPVHQESDFLERIVASARRR